MNFQNSDNQNILPSNSYDDAIIFFRYFSKMKAITGKSDINQNTETDENEEEIE